MTTEQAIEAPLSPQDVRKVLRLCSPAKLLYDVEPLEAVPLEEFRTTSALHKVRWPQIVAEVRARREALRRV